MHITIFEISALAAAFTWALTTLISPRPLAHLGTIAFNRWRMSIMFGVMAVYVLIMGTWRDIDPDTIWIILTSGFVGIFLGDTALFAAMNRLGPRRTSILFSMNAPLTAILGVIFLGDRLSLTQSVGIVVCITGVSMAIIFGKRRDQTHHWESIKGYLWVGVTLGMLAALGQAVGSIIVTPVLAAGADAIVVSTMRVGVAALCLNLVLILPHSYLRAQNPMNLSIFCWVFLSGFLAMAIGTTLVLFGLSGGQAGIIATLSATTPAMVLPLIWIFTGERPALAAWGGAALVLLGIALLFN